MLQTSLLSSKPRKAMSLAAIASLGVLALCFYSNVRIGSLTIFDIAAATYCAILLPYALLNGRGIDSLFRDPLLLSATAIFLLSVLSSGTVAHDAEGHFQRCLLLIGGLFLMIIFTRLIFASGRIGFHHVLQVLVLSSAVTGLVCIAQGKLGLFLELVHTQSGRVEFWTRPSGLVEHPVEAGLVAAYGALFAVSLILEGRRIVLNASCLAVILFSMTVSASLTGVATTLLGIGILLATRKSISLFVLVPAVGLAGIILFLLPDNVPGTFFVDRLIQLSRDGLQYQTLSTRANQIGKTIDIILSGGEKLVLGFGYDPDVQIDGEEIHNGLLAAQYHFGLLGSLSQLCFLGYFLSKAMKINSAANRMVALLAFLVFLLFYSSGPAFFRRSVWIPMFLVAAASSCEQGTDRARARGKSLHHAHT